MKKTVFVGLTAAALALTALSSQRAAAQCPPQCQRGGEVSFNLGLTFGCHWTPSHGHWVPNCPPPCCYGYPPCAPYGYPPVRPYGFPPPYGYAPVGYPGAPFAAPQPATAAAPNAPAAPNGPAATPATPATSSVAPTGLQNVGYEYPAAYGYDYGYGYGYPGEQVPGYWYER